MTIAATTSPREAARCTWDAVVVGAGPAGAMAARELARRGLTVLLVDRATFPRWKVCGCCLNAHALATLQAAGLRELVPQCGAVPLREICLAAVGRDARLPLSGGVSLSRETFDAALVRAAVEEGAAFLPQTHASLAPSTANCGTRTIELSAVGGGAPAVERVAARVVLVADGLSGKLVARAGVSGVAAAPGARIGAGVVAAEGPTFYSAGTIYMACGRDGYLGLVRLEDGRLDLAAALDPVWVRGCGGPGHAATQLLAEVGWPTVPRLAELGWRGTPALTRRARRLAAERLFLLGDAAGYIEPFTGEGMAWALASARAVAPLAARAVQRWHPKLTWEWGEAYRELIGRRQLVCRFISGVLRSPHLTRTLIYLLAYAPALAAPVVRYLGCAEIRNPKSEIRKKSQSPNPKLQMGL
ncbi:MAG TPA: FAD-dependent monooxygenase [Gemmataceae bacterium]